MRKSILLFFLGCLLTSSLFSQETEVLEKKEDSITYIKDLNYTDKKTFTEDLKSKYSGRDFTYKVEKKKKEKKKKEKEEIEKPDTPNSTFYEVFLGFMKFVFPFILGIIVIYIVLRLYLGSDAKFWYFKNSTKKVTKKLVYEDEDINDTDLESLLQKAIADKNTRLAIRYSYLILLKKLSDKKIIKYDKDKTNSDYLFEIEDANQRNQFSYVSYIYTYVWYGEFDLSEEDFIKIQEKYNSFFKTIN